jgi:hypothetical protein
MMTLKFQRKTLKSYVENIINKVDKKLKEGLWTLIKKDRACGDMRNIQNIFELLKGGQYPNTVTYWGFGRKIW